MPTHYADGGQPVVHFEPRLEVSPFALFRRLREGDPPLLYDVRPPGSQRTLRGAEPLPAAPWRPPEDRDTVLFDDDGGTATEMARRWSEAGATRVRALFGGLDLYAFALDPEVVGAETYLEGVPAPGRS
jgi:hypothetical protein